MDLKVDLSYKITFILAYAPDTLNFIFYIGGSFTYIIGCIAQCYKMMASEELSSK